jgi:hypothetical protein
VDRSDDNDHGRARRPLCRWYGHDHALERKHTTAYGYSYDQFGKYSSLGKEQLWGLESLEYRCRRGDRGGLGLGGGLYCYRGGAAYVVVYESEV